MAKKWSEVIESPDFQSLTPDQKFNAQVEYFAKVVKPQLPKEAHKSALQEFFTEFKPETFNHDPTEGMSGLEKSVAGFSQGVTKIGRGIGQLVGAVSREDVDEYNRLDAPLLKTPQGKYGSMAGGIVATLPAMAIPGANTALGATAIGAGMGAMEPVGTKDSRIANMARAGAGGLAGQKISSGLARVIKPNTRPEVKQLMDEGVTPTPGQILGGMAQRAEEGLTSVPILGDSIKAGQRRAVEDLNRAALNRVLEPIGKSLPKGAAVGNDAVAAVGDTISKSYDDLLPKLKVVADDVFSKEVDTVRQMATNLPPAQAQQFESILANDVIGKFTEQGRMMGETMKAVEGKLGGLIRQYGRSDNPDHRLLSDALKETQAALRRLVERGNPEQAGNLKAINTAWANLVRVESAAARLGSKEGTFSPAALRGAVKATDSSVRKRSFARGTALMQDLAESGEKVLGPKVPDSGTPFRLMNAAAAGGGWLLHPGIPLTALTGSAAYSRPGQYLAAALLARRPDGAGKIASGVRAASPMLSYAGTQLGLPAE